LPLFQTFELATRAQPVQIDSAAPELVQQERKTWFETFCCEILLQLMPSKCKKITLSIKNLSIHFG
jgi:hypothetical protein